MARTTKRELQAALDMLNDMTGRTEGQLGGFYVESWAPGDGWTRYRLMILGTNGEYRVGCYERISALYQQLMTTVEVLEIMAGGRHMIPGN
jgi:hypothetical protein